MKINIIFTLTIFAILSSIITARPTYITFNRSFDPTPRTGALIQLPILKYVFNFPSITGIFHVPCGSSNRGVEIVRDTDMTDLVDNQDGNRIIIYLPCDNDEDFDRWGG